MSDGYTSFSGTGGFRVTEVVSDGPVKPRMPSDGSCGCERFIRNEEHGIKLCEKHQREPGIHRYCLDVFR